MCIVYTAAAIHGMYTFTGETLCGLALHQVCIEEFILGCKKLRGQAPSARFVRLALALHRTGIQKMVVKSGEGPSLQQLAKGFPRTKLSALASPCRSQWGVFQVGETAGPRTRLSVLKLFPDLKRGTAVKPSCRSSQRPCLSNKAQLILGDMRIISTSWTQVFMSETSVRLTPATP